MTAGRVLPAVALSEKDTQKTDEAILPTERKLYNVSIGAAACAAQIVGSHKGCGFPLKGIRGHGNRQKAEPQYEKEEDP